MSFSDALRLLGRRWPLLLLVPLVLAGSTYFFARGLPQVFRSNTTIYTGIASGYSLSGNAEADYNKTSNAFDNLLNLVTARSTKQEVACQLLAQHLWATAQQPALLGAAPYRALAESLPIDVRRQLTGPTLAATLDHVRRLAQADNTNALYRLLNSVNTTYSLGALDRLSAVRIGASDLVKVEFESYDPELSRATLTLATQVLLAQSRDLRDGQTSSVISYYEAELAKAKARLSAAEAANLAFSRTHGIVDYDEQARTVTTEKEALAGELSQVNQQYAGAQAGLAAINRKLGGQQGALLNNRRVLEQRQKLGELNAAIADQQLLGRQEAGSEAKVRRLQAEADRTTQALRDNVDNYYTHSASAEGVPNEKLLNEYVQGMVQVETNRARLGVMNQRQQAFEREYQRMAPLGATLKKLGRDIDLAEKDYLAVLTSLNASKATQQNSSLTAKLKIVDPPNLPGKPSANKLLLLTLLSGLGGLTLITGLVLGAGLLDRSLRTPAVAAQRTGLPVAGLLPAAAARPTPLLAAARQRSLDQLVRHVLLKANTASTAAPFVVGVFSVERQPDGATLGQELARRCHARGIQTLALYPDDDDSTTPPDEESPTAPTLFYPTTAAAVRGWSLDELIQHAVPRCLPEVSAPAVQVLLIEFPALRDGYLPGGVLHQLHLIFLAVPATRPWQLTDHQTVETLRAATSAPVEVVLVGGEVVA